MYRGGDVDNYGISYFSLSYIYLLQSYKELSQIFTQGFEKRVYLFAFIKVCLNLAQGYNNNKIPSKKVEELRNILSSVFFIIY